MKFSNTLLANAIPLLSFLPLSTLAVPTNSSSPALTPRASLRGINCDGSNCHMNEPEIAILAGFIKYVDPDRTYLDKEPIACYKRTCAHLYNTGIGVNGSDVLALVNMMLQHCPNGHHGTVPTCALWQAEDWSGCRGKLNINCQYIHWERECEEGLCVRSAGTQASIDADPGFNPWAKKHDWSH